MVRIVRRHAHDVRNHLNILELESVLLGELISDPAVLESVRRIRTQLTQLDATVKALLFKFTEPCPTVVAAGDLLQLWKRQVSPLVSSKQAIQWPAAYETSQLSVDPNAVVFALRELTIAAWKRARGAPLKAFIHAKGDVVMIELSEPANEAPMTGDLMEDAVRLLHANGGRFDHTQISATGEWLSTVTFPTCLP